MKFKRPAHNAIWQILNSLNHDYLEEHQILFGGGTRIALELEEYRESIDIDFLCGTAEAYRAVRTQISNHGLGKLVNTDSKLELVREVRTDRDGTRTIVASPIKPVKLEFIRFDNTQLKKNTPKILEPIACIDQDSCFLTKLLANSDRHSSNEKKDIFDLCMMTHYWGKIPLAVWQQADRYYSYKTVLNTLLIALNSLIRQKKQSIELGIKKLAIHPDVATQIVEQYAPKLLKECQNQNINL